MRLRVEDRDRGFDRLMAELRWLQGKSVTVGWQGKSALESPGQMDATIVDIATFNEFGTITIPARPALASTFDDHAEDIERFMVSEMNKLLDGKQTARVMMNRIGMKAVSLVQARIRSSPSWAEPNAEATIEAKGSSTPLVDTGRLRATVTYAIRSGNSIIQEGKAAA